MKTVTILPTQNERWGFWGTASNTFSEDYVKKAWDAAFTLIKETAGFTPQETLALLDSRWGRHAVDEFITELRDGIKTFTTAFKNKMTKERLYRDFNYFIDPSSYKPKTTKEAKFCEELAKLSQKYGFVIQAVGGVSKGTEGFKGYNTDLDSGDLMPVWED